MNIENEVYPEANIMTTGALDDAMGDSIRAIVVATSQCRDYE